MVFFARKLIFLVENLPLWVENLHYLFENASSLRVVNVNTIPLKRVIFGKVYKPQIFSYRCLGYSVRYRNRSFYCRRACNVLQVSLPWNPHRLFRIPREDPSRHRETRSFLGLVLRSEFWAHLALSSAIPRKSKSLFKIFITSKPTITLPIFSSIYSLQNFILQHFLTEN